MYLLGSSELWCSRSLFQDSLAEVSSTVAATI